MPPKKYNRNNLTYGARRPARKSKPSDPQETRNPVQESPPSTLIPPNLETPSQSTPILSHSDEITTPVVESHQTLTSNVQDSPPFIVVPTILETPSQLNTNSAHSEEFELPQTHINGRNIESNVKYIGSNVKDFSETVSRATEAPVESIQGTLGEKELGDDGAGDEKRVAESETKNLLKKKKTKIVKRIVKRKVLRKVNHQQVESHQTLTNGSKINSNVQDSPSQSNTNSAHSEEFELPQTHINGRNIGSNVKFFSETVSRATEAPLESIQETLGEKELGDDGAGDEKMVAESDTKNVVKKKKTKIVKRIVKRKVLRKVNHQQIESLNQDLGKGLVGDVKVGSNESVHMEVENPNLKTVESVDVEISECTNNVVMGIEHCESSDVVKKSADGCESKWTCIAWSEAENCSVVGEEQKELESFEVVKHCVDVENLKKSHCPSFDVVIMQKETESCVEGKVDCSLTEDLSKVSGLDFDATNVTGTYLEERIVNHLQDQNHDFVVENRLDSESGVRKQEEGVENNLELKTKNCKQEEGVENSQEIGSDGKQEEGVNNKEECCDLGGMKAETSVGNTILSGEMGALERRRRRKTEIFVGGLDKDTSEEDIRKIFEVLGEIKDVTLVNSSKTKNKAFAFVRYTLAADAKKALIKYRKVEIHGKLCGTSPVEGNDTLFLGNINKRWKCDDVTKLLQGIGIEKIDHVTVMSDPSNIEFNRGFAFLELESNKDAQNAYKKLQKKGVFGKHLHIKVAWAEPLIEPDESELSKVKSVYAEYLPSSWDEEKVKDCFKRFGEIENVALARDMPSSRRKDYAFVNYKTRDAALACVEAFSHEEINDKGSKVKAKVSMAKPIPKGQQIKHLRTPPTKESKEKQKGTPLVKSLQGSRITGNLTSSNYDPRIVDQRSSMTSELVQLLREQASMRLTSPSLSTGFVNRQHPYPLPGRKRPFPVQEDGSHFSDLRGHPRARVEGSYPITNPSVPIRGVGMTSLPHQQQGASYISRPGYGLERHPSYILPRERARHHGNIGTYQRY